MGKDSTQGEKMPSIQRKQHSVFLENRTKAALEGITEVVNFDENQVVLMTDLGEMALEGNDLHVTSLLMEEGKLTVEGQISGIIYSGAPAKARQGLWRRVFK